MEYQWDKSLETGNQMIDTQHKQLFLAINNLIHTYESGKGKDELKRSLDFLNDYTIKHFFDEEQLQQQYKYPDFENHKKYHEGFKKEVRDLSVELIMKGVSDSLLKDVQVKIGDWLVTHIKGQDIKVAAHIKSHG
ncbi:MAG: hemerythrin family protein [Treponema sp.]|jgi:hemerythrin|nr:hemerythrin family protein [Treponema sp.]